MADRHCWADKATHMAEVHGFGSDEWLAAYLDNATCMLPHGHEGEHGWVSDDEIVVTFKEGNET
jgi:hypothetical protein